MNTRISARERDILGRIGLSADQSLPALAKLSGHKLHTVRYTISRLESRGILHRSWLIDIFRLGWLRFQVLLMIGAANREKFISFFSRSNRVVHIAEIGGDYDFDLLLLARDPKEVLTIFRDASKVCGDIFGEKAVILQTQVAYFPRKYLCHGKPLFSALQVGEREGRYELAPLEQLILEGLIKDPQISKRDLAMALSISIPTLDARLKKLRAEGVLRGAFFSPRYVQLGAQNYKILLKVSSASKELRDKVYLFSYRHPHCTSFREGIGEWDYELNAEVEGHRDITELKKDLWNTFAPALTSLAVIPRFKLLKFATYPITLSS